MIIADRDRELKELHAEVFGEQARGTVYTVPPPGRSLEDDELIASAHAAKNGAKFARLWRGDWTGYPSQSEGDLALTAMLLFWSGGESLQADRLFRSSGLMRPQWDERHRADGATYGEMTLEEALKGKTEFYAPPRWTQYDKVRPNGSERNGHGDAGVPGASDASAAEPGAPRRYPRTDLGNAERLVAAHGANLHYVHIYGKWLVWDGRRWKSDDTGEVERLAKATVRGIYAEAAACPEEQEREALAKHAVRSESEARLKSMIALAASELGIPVTPEQLDADPWLFNTLNGTLDLRTGLLRPHRRENLITRLAPGEYDADACCPLWWAFLKRVTGNNEALQRFLQRAAGYSLAGDTSERMLLVLYGRGRNGKGTLLETLAAVCGDYALHTPASTLLAKRDGSVPNDLARLKGARFVFTNETDQGKKLAEALVKEMTGDDTISARFMRAEWFDFRPEFQVWLATNHKPNISGSDNAIWDRIKLVPFTVRIPEEEQDPRLKERLRAELPGILAWAVCGCLDWQEHGLGVPKEVWEATDRYRAEMDVLAEFLTERCAMGANLKVSARDLYAAYTDWCQKGGEKPLTQRELGIRFKERSIPGCDHKRGHGGAYWWYGFGLRTAAEGEPGE